MGDGIGDALNIHSVKAEYVPWVIAAGKLCPAVKAPITAAQIEVDGLHPWRGYRHAAQAPPHQAEAEGGEAGGHCGSGSRAVRRPGSRGPGHRIIDARSPGAGVARSSFGQRADSRPASRRRAAAEARAGRGACKRHSPSELRRIRSLAESGELEQAAALVSELDEVAMREHGASDPTALQAREVRVHLAAQRGDIAAAVVMYAEVAERSQLQGDMAQGNTVAGRAHFLRLTIEDLHEAAVVGIIAVRMRQMLSGEDKAPFHQAERRQAELTAALRPATHM